MPQAEPSASCFAGRQFFLSTFKTDKELELDLLD